MTRCTVVATFILFPFVTACSANGVNPTVAHTAFTPIVTTSSAPTSTTQTSAPRTTTSTVPSPRAITTHAVSGSPTEPARQFISALFNGRPLATPVTDIELWRRVVSGGSIIQVETISEAAGRASVGVSLSFEPANDGEITEPIGVRVELVADSNGWIVTGVGYL
jgi:hypothetical protein